MCLNTLQSHVRSLAHAFVVAVVCFCSFALYQQQDTAKAEIFSDENPERLKFSPLKPGIGQNIDMHVSPITGKFLLSDSYITSGPFKFIFFKNLSKFIPPML